MLVTRAENVVVSGSFIIHAPKSNNHNKEAADYLAHVKIEGLGWAHAIVA